MEAEGHDVETILDFLRRNGATKIESIRVLVELLGISNSEAKLAVHHSDTWRDTRKADERLHNQLKRSIERLLNRRK